MMAKRLLLSGIFLLVLCPTLVLAQVGTNSLFPVLRAVPTTTETTGTAARLDIIVEADTYVPSFYKGRREPTPNSRARIVAVVPPGISVASFHWQVGNQNLVSTSPSVSLAMPAFGGDLRISVNALDSTGKAVGNATEIIRLSEPQLLFYETNNLRGVSRTSIGESLILVGDEVSVKAEPYFFNTRSILTRAIGSWSGREIEVVTDDTDWRKAALLRASSTADKTTIRLDVRSRDNLSETVNGSFDLQL